jgi:hypothetical protein
MEVALVSQQEPLGHVVRIHPVALFFFWVHKHILYLSDNLFFQKKKKKKKKAVKRVREKGRTTKLGLNESERCNLTFKFTGTVDPYHTQNIRASPLEYTLESKKNLCIEVYVLSSLFSESLSI